MAPKKDLASLAAKEAVAEKAAGKRKRLAAAAEKEFRRLRRGTMAAKETQAPVAKRSKKSFPTW